MEITKDIIYVGFPSIVALLLASFSAILLNRVMIHFSVNHVALLGIVGALESISTLPVYGLSIGAMTLAGMFFGAKKYKLLQSTSWYALGAGALVAAVVGLIIFIFPEQLIKLFTNDAGVISIGAIYLRIYVFALPLSAMVMILSRILQSMGYGVSGMVIGLIRSLIISIPLAYLFVFALGYGYLSIAIALVLGSLVSVAIGSWWLEKRIRRY
jgi:Na+-driven multidrug efflux pump